MSYAAFARPPRSNSWRLVRGALFCLIEFSILFSMAAASGVVNGNPSVLGWRLGLWLWGFSLALLTLYVAIARWVKRATVFYLLEHVAAELMMLGFLVLGMSMLGHLLGPNAVYILGGGALAGWVAMAPRVPARRAWFRVAVRQGHLVKSLDAEHATWDTRHDHDQAAAELREFENRGCLTRMLPWIGPAIGMGLADVVGRWNAMVIVALILLAMGYWALGMGTVNALARHLELRRLEGLLGRPILLAEYVGPEKG